MTNRVVFVGSINVDSILHIDQLPQPGETINMRSFSKAAGGKGANQAVAAARAGAQTTFIGRIGADSNGDFMRSQLTENHIDISHVSTKDELQTGQAYILLQKSGQNSIIVQHGANYALSEADVLTAKPIISTADFVVTELETPIPAAVAAFKLAHEAGRKTIFNPAPAQHELPKNLLNLTDLIVPNETESEMITGIKVTDQASMRASARYYHDLGIDNVIITLGDQGSFMSCQGVDQMVPAFKVKALDTTAAGDTFIGALAAELRPDFTNIKAAVVYASKASSLTVQKLGAFPSIPTRQEVAKTLY